LETIHESEKTVDEPGSASVGDQADPDEAGHERSVGRDDPYVASARERQAGAGAGAVDRREHGLLERTNRPDVGVVCRFQGLSDAAWQLLELAKILAGTETAPGTREDDCANRGVRRSGECRSESVVHRAIDRVVDVRAVERDRENRALA
jgi:hypothetical protein